MTHKIDIYSALSAQIIVDIMRIATWNPINASS